MNGNIDINTVLAFISIIVAIVLAYIQTNKKNYKL